MASHAAVAVRRLGARLRLVTVGSRSLLFVACLVGGAAVYAAARGLEVAPRMTLAIVTWAALLWITEALPLHITAVAVLAAEIVALGLPGRPLAHVGVKGFVAAFFDPVLLLFLGGFVLGEGISRCGLDRLLVQGMLRRIPATAPWVLAGTLAVTGFISMWMSNTATAALMMAVMLPLINRLDADDPFRRALLLAVPFAANIGGMGTPVGTPPNVIALGAMERLGVRVSFLQWMGMTVPVTVLLLVFVWWVLLRSFPPKRLSLAGLRDAVEAAVRLSPQQRGVLWVFVLTAAGWLTTIWHGIPEPVVALLPVVVLFGVGWLPAGAFRSLEWDILMLMGGGLSLGYALQESGLARWAVVQLNLGAMAPWVAAAAASALGVLISTFISNTAAAALLVPVVAGVGGPAGAPLAVAAAIGVSGAMSLPVSTPPNAIAFASGQVRVRDMARVGGLVGLLTVVLGTVAAMLFLGPGA